MSNNLKPRGVLAVRASAPVPAAVLAQLQNAFSDFKADHDERISNLQSALDETNAKLAVARLGTGTDTERPGTKEAQASMTEFMRSGRVAAVGSTGLQARSMSTDSDPDGGWTVPKQVDQVIQNQMILISPMRRPARITAWAICRCKMSST